jgi:hypothetical protein
MKLLLPCLALPRDHPRAPGLLDFLLGLKFSKKDRAAVPLRSSYSLNQVEYALNVVFRRNFPIHKILERSAELGLLRLTADKVTQIFGVRKHKRRRGKLHSVLEKLDHGHHVLRIYCQSLVARMYEQFSTFLRMEICVNHLTRNWRVTYERPRHSSTTLPAAADLLVNSMATREDPFPRTPFLDRERGGEARRNMIHPPEVGLRDHFRIADSESDRR